jgi:hypothetical protein
MVMKVCLFTTVTPAKLSILINWKGNEMSNQEVTVISDIDSGPLTAKDIRAQVNLIQEVMASVMKNGEHYGTIPGAGTKKVLFKSGAEKIIATFRLAVDPVVEDVSAEGEIRYRVKCRLITTNGVFVGSGIGEASTSETKYAWRAALCQEEFDCTPDYLRRTIWKKDGGNDIKIVSARPPDCRPNSVPRS